MTEKRVVRTATTTAMEGLKGEKFDDGGGGGGGFSGEGEIMRRPKATEEVKKSKKIMI